jgi:hypothetical protein
VTDPVVAAGPVLLEIGDPRWRSFVAAREDAVPFHEPA